MKLQLMVLGIIFGAASGFGKPPQQQPHHHHPGNNNRFYELNSKIIASPKPRSYSNVASPPNYRTVNPVYVPYRTPRSSHHHHHYSQSPPPQMMVAAPSNSPVLVLKKDHARPLLTSAVMPPTKRSEHIPTISHHMDHMVEAASNITTTTRPASPPPPSANHHKELISEEEEEEHHEIASSAPSAPPAQPPSAPSAPSAGPTASAERRMFFENVATNSGLAHQVSGPRHTPKQAATSSLPHHHAARQPPQRRDDDEDDDEDKERIVRSNANHHPYQSGFQYPPPQGNYIAQGPTRVPVKYQQGVVGLKPQPPHQFLNGPPHIQQQRKPPQHQQQQQQRPYKQRIQQNQGGVGSDEPLSEEDEEAEAQPDRLTELLATSKFACSGKKDGYYADDTLNCEVFHYCQDGGKHSWLCPNGFAFHQIHLICVPPSSDNICKQSSNFHFVNEYLYKPINEKEANTYNESLKYADRYFPDGYNHGAGDVLLPYNNNQEQDSSEEGRVRGPQQQHTIRSNAYSQQQPPPRAGPYNPYVEQRPTHIQGGFIPSQQINPRIPLINSPRINPYTQHSSQSQVVQTVVPQQQQPKQSKKQVASNSPVFFTPESINIPLNQRRPIPNPHPSHHPQIFRASPQAQSKKHSHHHHHHHSNKQQQVKRKFEDYEY